LTTRVAVKNVDPTTSYIVFELTHMTLGAASYTGLPLHAAL
jgi:hypothetical protein